MATAGEPMDKGDEVEEDSDAPLSLTPEQQPASRGEQDEEVKLYHSSQLIQVSLEEYKHQASIGTQQAVRQLKMSPEFKMHVQKCHSCGSSWYHGQWSADCLECGGHAMRRPCPICEGKCGREWGRNISMSHQLHYAHWDGGCSLEEEEWTQHALRTLAELDSAAALGEALEDVKM